LLVVYAKDEILTEEMKGGGVAPKGRRGRPLMTALCSSFRIGKTSPVFTIQNGLIEHEGNDKKIRENVLPKVSISIHEVRRNKTHDVN